VALISSNFYLQSFQNKLKREDAFTRLNLAKINEEWRSMLRQIKCKELKDEVVALQSVCGESLDHKNSVLKRLLCDLDESEELYSALLNCHMENIGRLMGKYRLGLEVKFQIELFYLLITSNSQ
jgi:dynein regulatory complex subunit 2